ncbi:MAG TPA: ATPase, T2SS/T4P/T4SS family, partial [Blastocatellia bacterium]|nr:ATPase, T2SS/T4P/T4SS family [Blastocatellia bacterium]
MSPSIDQLLTIACSKGASDLHIKAGSFPFMRINGELQPMVEAQRLAGEDSLNMAFSIMNNRQKQRFNENSEIDIAYGVSGLGRFRCNIFQQRGTVGMVLRVIPTTVRSTEELRLPPVIEKIADENRGLVLVTGSTGSGKSTTLAAMIDYMNRTRTGHIVTIEDPIEFLHRDKKSYVNQREVDVDTRSFSEALR